MKKAILVVFVIILMLVVYLSVSKSPVDPLAYSPPKKPDMTGVLAPNNLLQGAELLAKGKIDGPEEVAVDGRDRVYGGTWGGKIMRILPNGANGAIETFADTGGRTLGMKFNRNGNLIVCDSHKGLLSINKKGKITTLATSAEGTPFKFTDALDISRKGVIYFTDASDKFGQNDYLFDFMEARPHGRFMKYDPATKKVSVLLRGLYFANGVALSQKEDFVLVNETYKYRIQRYWLTGPKAGKSEIFIDNLPGFPDNISSNRKGRFWLALFTIRNDMLDGIHPYPSIKKLMAKLPRATWQKPKRYGFVIALDERGKITGTLQDPTGEHLYEITSAQQYNGYLYLGSLHADRIGKYALKK
ncbi:MAG: gluconolactonase [Spirochaetes bacterium RBG_13_51_14]|nr:MAG: gluconolactonase [Spirochaetes bacterium RBG_13_51_14]